MFVNTDFIPKEKQFRNSVPLKVIEAPEPGDVIWQNLQVSDKEIFEKELFFKSVSFLVLVCSFGLILGISIG